MKALMIILLILTTSIGFANGEEVKSKDDSGIQSYDIKVENDALKFSVTISDQSDCVYLLVRFNPDGTIRPVGLKDSQGFNEDGNEYTFTDRNQPSQDAEYGLYRSADESTLIGKWEYDGSTNELSKVALTEEQPK